MSNAISMDLWKVMVLMPHPDMSSVLAVFLSRLVVLVSVCVVAHLVAMVVVSSPHMARCLAVFLSRLVVLVSVCVMAHLVAMVVLVVVIIMVAFLI